MREAARLAANNEYRCRFCKQVFPVQEGIVTTWGGNVLFALCPECHPGRPIVMRVQDDSMGRKGVFVGFLNEADIPRNDIFVTSDLRDAERFAERNSTFKPTNMWEEDPDE